MSQDSNLPPGVSLSMIPGNRPEDLADEAFWEEHEKTFAEKFPEESKVMADVLNNELATSQLDALDEYLRLARDMAYERGVQEGRHEEQMAKWDKVVERTDADVRRDMRVAHAEGWHNESPREFCQDCKAEGRV